MLYSMACENVSRSLLVGEQSKSSTKLQVRSLEEPTSKNQTVEKTCEEKRSTLPNLNRTATSKTPS